MRTALAPRNVCYTIGPGSVAVSFFFFSEFRHSRHPTDALPIPKTEAGGHLMYSPQIEQDFRLPQTFRAWWTSTVLLHSSRSGRKRTSLSCENNAAHASATTAETNDVQAFPSIHLRSRKVTAELTKTKKASKQASGRLFFLSLPFFPETKRC